jgi:hypothetical protein
MAYNKSARRQIQMPSDRAVVVTTGAVGFQYGRNVFLKIDRRG